jgi:hypothetical protein
MRIMITIPMRSGAIALVLIGAALVQGCSSQTPMVAMQSMPTANAGIYSGVPWYADLDAMMTAESGGD